MKASPRDDLKAAHRHVATAPRPRLSLLAKVLVAVVVVYRRVISPMLPPSCRFYPSCSEYALTALRRHGAVVGFWLTIRRVARCHPWNPGGYDPVPPPGAKTSRRPLGAKARAARAGMTRGAPRCRTY